MKEKEKIQLTTQAGVPVADNQNILTAGERGPALLQNVWYMEKLGHFNRERIPERVVHAKGSGAYGNLTVTEDITRYTKAALFSEVGKKTDLFLRFSTVAGERGAADTERDVRGFAVKFYTEEGNWDLVGNNTPVFFIRDPLKFPDFIHTQKRDPKTNLRSNTAMWDFWSLSPETLHQVMILMSDRGIPQDYRHMHGFGSHTYSFINAEGERFWVKFHFKSLQGIANFTDSEAASIVAKDREYSQRDLFENIAKGNFPKWRFCIQIMTEDEARNRKENPFDLTKVWSQKEYPLIDVGILELNRNPEAWQKLGIGKQRNNSILLYRLITIAAVTFLIAGFSWWWIYDRQDWIVIASSAHAVKEVTLPDNSHITLAENSALQYDRLAYGKKNRNVTLNGKAYFSVTHQEQCPFRVQTELANIQVLGTQFQVTANANQTSATVESGKVRFYNKEQKEAILTKGMYAFLKLWVEHTERWYMTPVRHWQRRSASASALESCFSRAF